MVDVPKRLGAWSGQAPLPNGISAARPQPPGPESYRGQQPVGPRITAPYESRVWSGGDNTNNDHLYRDAHIYAVTGTERSGRRSGNHDVMLDGPVRPSYRMLVRRWNKWVGTDNTRNQDDFSRGFHWLGEAGAKYTPIYGGQPGYYLPYGQRGGPGVDTIAGVTGPTLIKGDKPHGLHTSPLYRSGEQIAKRYGAIPQMRGTRVDRIANSNRAGQSYSQTTRPQGG